MSTHYYIEYIQDPHLNITVGYKLHHIAGYQPLSNDSPDITNIDYNSAYKSKITANYAAREVLRSTRNSLKVALKKLDTFLDKGKL